MPFISTGVRVLVPTANQAGGALSAYFWGSVTADHMHQQSRIHHHIGIQEGPRRIVLASCVQQSAKTNSR